MSSGIPPDQVIREILSYFLRHPRAADSLEGIARWRLLDEVVHRKVDETRLALTWLVERGYLSETALTGIDPVYRLRDEKRVEAERLLATEGGALCR